MATSLAAQLQQLAANSTNSLDLKAQRVAHAQSLIFEAKLAATQDFDTIFQVCQEGYHELCALDPRFVGFRRSIFSEHSKTQDRTQMTAGENEVLNRTLEDFMGLVGGRLLLKPGLRAIEWLVRRFRYGDIDAEPNLNSANTDCTTGSISTTHRVSCSHFCPTTRLQCSLPYFRSYPQRSLPASNSYTHISNL